MRKRVHELNQIPTEFHENGAPELPPLPDEYNRDQKTGRPKEKKESSIRKAMLYLAAAGLTVLGLITPVVRLNAPEKTPVPTPAPTAVVEVQETPKPTEAPTSEPTPVPTPEPLTGQIHIVVYSDIINIEAAMAGHPESFVLDEQTFDAASFERYALPPLPTHAGYTALGYVLFAENSEAYFNNLVVEGGERHVGGSVALTDAVTADDIRIVPINEQGVREAEVHTVWLEEDSIFVLEFYDDSLFGSYHVGFPMDSEGLLYLAAFPTPTREGYTFAGWCDESGTPVDTVTYFDFLEPLTVKKPHTECTPCGKTGPAQYPCLSLIRTVRWSISSRIRCVTAPWYFPTRPIPLRCMCVSGRTS